MFSLKIRAGALGVLAIASATFGLPEDQAIFTSFEGIATSTGTPFDIGTSPETATFSGNAFSRSLGITALYHTGDWAWMVNPGGLGQITFDTDAATVEFFTRTDPSAAASTFIEAFDLGSNSLGSFTVTSAQGWRLISFSGAIHRIDVTNNDAGRMNSIDDFGYTPIPAPGPMGLVAVGLGLAPRRRRGA